MHILKKKIRTACGLSDKDGDVGVEKCCTGRVKIGKITGGNSARFVPKTIHNLEKRVAVDNKQKFQEKKWGDILVHKLESYQHFVCG